MQVTFAVLADYANVSREGKLNVMGIFDRVFARQLPSRFPPMQLVIRLQVDPSELNAEHSIRIQLVDPDDQAVFDINGGFTPRSPQGDHPVSVNHVIQLTDLPLRVTGTHQAVVWVDGEQKRAVPLRVDEAPQSPPGPVGDPGSEPTFH